MTYPPTQPTNPGYPAPQPSAAYQAPSAPQYPAAAGAPPPGGGGGAGPTGTP